MRGGRGGGGGGLTEGGSGRFRERGIFRDRAFSKTYCSVISRGPGRWRQWFPTV